MSAVPEPRENGAMTSDGADPAAASDPCCAPTIVPLPPEGERRPALLLDSAERLILGLRLTLALAA
ncbi:MAG TPA: hypothetical protein VEV18_02930, partial [Steroidobacteraceae bacterium]|nr:hypothetical protein [Steroidobacteraceae bacterium]